MPNDALRALQSSVEELHDLSPPTDIDPIRLQWLPKLEDQVAWINGNLEAAAQALETGRDQEGRPITNAQIASGLRKLSSMVRDDEYLEYLETARPGISPVLRHRMDALDGIITGIEAPASVVDRATGLYQSSKGVAALIHLSTEQPADAAAYRRRAVEEFGREGAPGSDALAVLIREMARCRSPQIVDALVVAGRVRPTSDLLDAVDAVAHSAEMTEAPPELLFTPGMIGGGRVGWTGHSRIVAVALEAKAALESHA